LRIPRYIRLNPRICLDINLPEAAAVMEMPGFFELPGNSNISNSQAYRQGKIFGMDLGSALAVRALDVQPNDQVLDLCCAPGAKMLLIVDSLSMIGTVTGVDLSTDRLSICRSLLRKYRAFNYRLFHEDGARFNVYSPSRVNGRSRFAGGCTHHQGPSVRRRRVFHAPKGLRSDPQLRHPDLLYDRVLVDAECTHDGSVAHVRKYLSENPTTRVEEKFLHPDHVASVPDLQFRLLENGWELLKPGGLLVYSTCSLTVTQNEACVARFLTQYHGALLEPVWLPKGVKSAATKAVAGIDGIDWGRMVRLEPWCSRTSGMFIARLRKTALAESNV